MGLPLAVAAPGDIDELGFVDSAARCGPGEIAALIGRTETSRVAICKLPNSQYEYRGVRIDDGASATIPAIKSGGVAFIAQEGLTTYSASTSSLVISKQGRVIRREEWLEFRRPGAPPTTAAPTTPSTPPTTPSTQTTAPQSDEPDSSSADATSSAEPSGPSGATQQPAEPLPPPLPAEVGGR